MALATSAMAAQYDEALGLKAMYYAGAAYCSLSDLKAWSCGEPCQPGVSDFIPISNGLLNTFGYVAYNEAENRIVASFRGTVMGTILNWISDLDFKSVQYHELEGSLVHEGFYLTYNQISS